jgi:hypothetical protein
LQSVHEFLAVAAVAAVVVAVAWAALLVFTGRDAGRRFRGAERVVIGLIVLAAVAGAVQFATGARPADGLHLLYGGAAIVVIPVARSFQNGAGSRAGIVMLLGFVVLAGVLYRLFATG